MLVALLVMLRCAVLPGRAQNYIFYNANYGYLINNSGNPGVSTTFTKSAIWIANNTMGTSNRNVRSYTDGTKYFTGSAGTSNTENGTFSLGATNDNWQLRGTNYLNRRNANRGYVRYNGTGFIVNSSNADQNFTGLAITISSQSAANPTISITAAEGLSNGGIQLTGNVTGTYRPAYSYATVRNYNNNNTQTYYWTATTDATTTNPTITDWSDATITWTVTTGGTYASVNSEGLVTITANPTGNIVVRMDVSKGGYTGNTTITLTRGNMAQSSNTETVITGLSISPSSSALYYNDVNQIFTATASAASITNTIPAHTTFSGSGNIYHYYNGTLYTNPNDFVSTEETPVAVTLNWALSGAAASYLTRTPASGTSTTVTHSTQSPSDQTATLTVTASAAGASNKTATATITAYGPMVAPTITRTGNTISLAATNAGATIYYTTDGSTPTAESTEYTAPFDLTTSPTTIKAIAVRDGHSSTVATETYQIQLATPTITVSNTGLATITAEAGTTIHYTTDGTIPTESSPTYSAPEQLTNPQIIMAIAVKTDYATSDVAMADFVTQGVAGGKVILDDREDHSWSYYSDASLPAQLHSLNPADVKITYRGNGNNVSTSNDANPGTNTFTASSDNSVKVGIDAPDSTFIYIKTLERTDGSTSANPTGRCAYTTIPNPFSVRPTYGSGDTRWRGFYKWRVVSVSGGTIYDAAIGGNQITAGGTIDAEQTVYFAPTSEYSMQVVLEALWARMYVGGGYQASVGYERNYVVGGAAVDFPATYSAIYPNGTTNGTTAANTVPGTYDPSAARTLSHDTKFEYINLTGNRTYTANNHYLCFGRGISTANNAGTVQGINANAADLNYTIRIESGQLYELSFVKASTQTVSGRYYIKSILGCDYDRATNTNNKLSISSGRQLFFSQQVSYSGSSNRDAKTFDLVVKSGQYQSSMWNNQNNSGGGGYQNSFYCGPNQGDNNYPGFRYVVIEGGEMGCLNGGRGTNGAKGTYAPSSDENPTFTARIKGGLIHGAVFGGAADSDSPGSRRIIVTGGTIEGWIAAGANGTGSSGGTNSARSDGNSYIYVGGDALCGGPNVKTVNLTVGGQVFGAGRGQNGQEASINNSNVVVADEAEISGTGGGNVYGGGYTGYVKQVSNVYVVGGTVENKVCGGAYGNAATIPTVNVTMTGGTVNNGVYGGSDNSGDVGNVTMHIDGGTVGDGESGDGVFGGGFGQSTNVTGNVSLNLGTCGAASGATIYGDVYGGSALGTVNTNANNTTNVSLYKGTIYGGLYGGGYGPGGVAANVNGKVYVNVLGGSVRCSTGDPDGEAGTGSVFGCNNAGGAPQSEVHVDIYNTDQPLSGYALHAVYGGGNKAAYNGTPEVTIHGCSNSIEYVYGGGNATDVRGTDVTIWGGQIGNAFAGGNGFSETNNHTQSNQPHYNPGANITTSGTHLTIHGGTIGAAFGGSNQYGTITGGVNVTVSDDSEAGSDPCGNPFTSCPMDIAELYGGGNEAPLISSRNPNVFIGKNDIHVSLDCSAKVGMLFGGAKAADYEGDIDLVVDGGTFNKVFGGNNMGGTITGNVSVTFNGGSANEVYGGCNQSGTITGTVIVTIDSTNATCDPPFYVGDVYGGGNLAGYSHPAGQYPEVNVINGCVRGNVYGGGFGSTATVTGSPKVTIGDNNPNRRVTVGGDVYGGGNAAPVTNNTEVLVTGKTKVFGNIYGGGNQGEVNGNTKVIINSK